MILPIPAKLAMDIRILRLVSFVIPQISGEDPDLVTLLPQPARRRLPDHLIPAKRVWRVGAPYRQDPRHRAVENTLAAPARVTMVP
jgi:hypothetical protein